MDLSWSEIKIRHYPPRTLKSVGSEGVNFRLLSKVRIISCLRKSALLKISGLKKELYETRKLLISYWCLGPESNRHSVTTEGF